MQTVHTTIVYWLVAASVLTSVVASYTAYGFTETSGSNRPEGPIGFGWPVARGRSGWESGRCITSACWPCAFPMEVVYHLPTVRVCPWCSRSWRLRWFLPILTKKTIPRRFDSFAGSLMLGAGIGGMHYVGMHAMRLQRDAPLRRGDGLLCLSWSPWSFSWMAIEISITLRRRSDIREWLRVLGATVMGPGYRGHALHRHGSGDF